MADTWPVGDPLERGNGGGAGGGLIGAISGFAGVVGAGASRGFGLGDAASGMAGTAEEPPAVRETFADRLRAGAQDAVLGQYPGYRTLWNYDASGLHVTQKGWIVVAGAGFALWLMLGGR